MVWKFCEHDSLRKWGVWTKCLNGHYTYYSPW